MKLTKLLSILLLLCLVSSLLLVGCNKEDGTNSQVSETPANKEYLDLVDGRFYQGKTITFLTTSVNETYESEILSNTEAYNDGLDQVLPSSVNDDMKERANILEAVLGVTIEEEKCFETKRPGGEICTKISNDALAGTANYQVVVPCLFDAAKLALDELFVNLRSVEGLQLEAPWWNQTFNNSMTFAGQLYFTIGDLGLANKNSTAALYVNLDLWDKYSLSEKMGGSPYELVRSGKWTLDVVTSAAKYLSIDENKDNKIDYKDSVGWGGSRDDMWSLFYGSGETVADIGADDLPEITIYNERSSKVMGKMLDLVQDNKHYIEADDYFGIVKWPSVLVQEAFTTGRALFYNGNVSTIIGLRDMEQRFAIVPIPKYEEKQENYHSLINPWTSTCFAIPVSVVGDELKMVADCLNVLGAISKNTVAKNYQEIVIEGRSLRDDDSVDMLNNYIIANYGVDMGMVYRWGDLHSLLQQMADLSSGAFSSKVDSKLSAAEYQMKEVTDFYQSKAQ